MTDWKVENIATLANGKKASEISSAGRYPIYGGNGIMGYSSVMNAENVVIVGRVGAYCGSVHYSPTECWISDNAISAYAKPGNSLKYLYYLLKFLDLNKHHIGGAQPLMTQGIINNINIPRHTLEEQKKIASILSTLDEKIETNRKINARLEELAQALFKSWFIDFEPFGGKMPADWEVCPIDDVYLIKYGKGLPKSDLHTEGYPVYGANGIIGYSNQNNVDKIVTLITSRGNGSGDLSYTKHKHAFITNNSFIVEPREYYSYIELPYIYQSFLRIDFKALCSGSAQPQLTNSAISSLNITLPPRDIIVKFTSMAAPLYNKMLSLYHESSRLTELRDTLLPKLMSGEIKIEQSSL